MRVCSREIVLLNFFATKKPPNPRHAPHASVARWDDGSKQRLDVLVSSIISPTFMTESSSLSSDQRSAIQINIMDAYTAAE